MIPLKLQMKNFLSYGDQSQTIDFAPYNLIYLSGKNGHGKSALLDAITWAIWGQARKVTNAVRADQGLMRLGQTHMLVLLDFELNGQQYRVRRELSMHHGKAIAYLEFGIIDPKSQEHIPLTDKTIRATQRKIEETIHLDFESFANSAFLRQGHSNEFCKKSPKDRKDILASILGLNKFDVIKKRALEKTKDALSQQKTLRVFHEKIEDQLKQKTEIISQITTATKDITALNTSMQSHEHAYKAIEKKKTAYVQLQKEFEVTSFKQNEAHKNIQLHTKTVAQELKTWRSVHAQTISTKDIKALEAQKTDLQVRIKNHQIAFQKTLQSREQVLKLKEQLQLKKNDLERTSHELIQKHTLELEQQKYKLKELETSITTHAEKRKALEKKLGSIDPAQLIKLQASHESQFEKRKNFYQHCITQGNFFKAELDTHNPKNTLVLDDNPSCPLCDQNLSAARKKFLKNKMTKQHRFVMHQLTRITNIITKLKALLIEQHTTIKNNAELINNCNELTKINELLKPLETNVKTITATLAIEEKRHIERIQHQKSSIESNIEYKQLVTQLKKHEAENNIIKYNKEQHSKDDIQLEAIEKEYATFMQLQKEVHQQAQRKQTIKDTIQIIRAEQKKHTILELQGKEIQKKIQDMMSLQQEQTAWDTQNKRLLEQKEMLVKQATQLQTQLKHLEALEKEQKEQQKIIADLNTTIEEYQLIAQATGKDGIQALLIEESIPEIEEAANDLLSRLTNNQSQVFIESLRDLKKGGSKETLEIKISDATGIRPYELFSGGEAFRIDFSLRIAISKLLARRAGTALETLIIDEGFGSQDEEGLSLIMDAIHTIQDDFKKVIVVSHLQTMKEQFPVHFVVQKGISGSTVTVMQQG